MFKIDDFEVECFENKLAGETTGQRSSEEGRSQ